MTGTSDLASQQRRPQAVQRNSDVDCTALTDKMRDDDPSVFDDLKRIFGAGLHFFLKRADVPVSDYGTLVEKCFSILQNQIKNDPFFDSSSIPRCILAIVKSFAAVGRVSSAKPAEVETATIALRQMSVECRQAVSLYFADGQTESEICTRLGISASTFHQYKSEAKFAFINASSLRFII